MDTVTIPDEVVREAQTYQDRVLAHLVGGRNYTGLEAPNAYRLGYICEWAFHQWLTARAIPHTWNQRDDGQAGPPDFTVAMPRKGYIEVKGTSHPGAAWLLIPQAQWDRYGEGYNWLVAAQYDPLKQVVTFRGCCSGDYFSRWSVDLDFGYGPTRGVRYGQLDELEVLELVLEHP